MDFINNLKKLCGNKSVKNLLYIAMAAITLLLLWMCIALFNLGQFFEDIELKTLDLRFKLPLKQAQHNPNVVILAIDDDSLESLESDFGRWPWPRGVHADIARTVSESGAEAVAFDLMFLGKQLGYEDQDEKLVNTMKALKNVYLGMNFDNREDGNSLEIIKLIQKLAIKVRNESNIDFYDISMPNCRTILPELLKATKNIGIINHARDLDGISRRNSPFFIYRGKFYPYLAVKVAADYMYKKTKTPISEWIVTKDKFLIMGNTKIPLGDDGKMLVNWYGKDKTYEYIPVWKLIQAIKQIKQGVPPVLDLKKTFKNKIVFVGATASSLFDIKSTPYSSVHPGVELQATIINNIIDKQFLVRAHWYVNLIICVLLFLFTAVCVLRINSSAAVLITTLSIMVSYVSFACAIFGYASIWLDIIYPLLVVSITFTIMYVIKYVIKSKDFEYTYKLATTDGLTGLHNHRYFQERMVQNIERCSRYNAHFSLLLVDIDLFKKFNDNYGHQAGDAVLRQVAETLKKAVRASDLVARYGGEEMAIVLDNANIDEALSIANKICKTVASKPFKLSEAIEKNVTISLGVATFPQHGKIPSELIEFADVCLYRAKHNGRNQVGALEDENENLEESETI